MKREAIKLVVFTLLVISLLSFAIAIFSEDTTNWNLTIDGNTGGGDVARSIAVDSNDRIYIVGNGEDIVSATSNRDWWIKQFSTNGVENASWNKSYTTDTGSDTPYGVAVDSENNVYAVGVKNQVDWLIKKYFSNGSEDDVNWNKAFDGVGGVDIAYGVAVDSENNVYVAGLANNMASGTSIGDWWIKKFNSSGTEDTANWNKNFSSPGGLSDSASAITIDSNGDVYVGGAFSNNGAIKKFNSSGTEDTVNWNKTFEFSGNNEINSLDIDSDGNLYAVGKGTNIVSASSNQDMIIKKYNSSGTEDAVNWNKSINARDGSDYLQAVKVDSDGNVYVAGSGVHVLSASSGVDWWIKKYNSSGTEDVTNWNITYNSGYVVYAIDIDSAGDIYFGGTSNNNLDWHIKKYIYLIPFVVSIISPSANTYVNSPTIPIEVKINNSGICNYTLDLGTTNTTLTANASATGFTSSRTFSNGAYSFYAYCVDDNGQKNYTTSVNFSVSYTAPVVEETVGSPPASQTGGEIDTPAEPSCEEVWICSLWGDCVNGISTRECEDLAECGTSVDKPAETQSCSVQECTPNFLCGEWSSCNYVGDIGDILSGEIGTSGRTRTCEDSNNCLSSYVETSECEIELSDDGEGDSSISEFEIEIETLPSGESSLVTKNSATGKPTSRINLDALKKGRLEVSFVQDEDSYPEHCFNALLDGDELGIDCGGSCEYCGFNNKKYSLFPWIMFGLLISTLAGGMSLHSLDKTRRRKIENWLEEGEKSLNTAELTGSHDDLKDAVEYYNLIKKNFSKLGIGNRGLLRDDVEIYRKRLNKQIGRFNQPAHSDIKEKREERFKKFYEKRK